MGLLHLIEKHDGIRLPSNGIGKLTTLVVSDISWRCTNQPRHSMLLHKLRHINANEGFFRIKHEIRQRFAKLRLSDAGRSKEDETRNRLTWIIEAGPRSLNGLGHNLDGLILTLDTFAQLILHRQQPFPLGLHHSIRWDTGGNCNNGSDVIGGDFISQHFASIDILADLRGGLLDYLQLLFQLGEDGVLQLSSLVQIKITLGLFDLQIYIDNLLLQLGNLADAASFGLPLSCELLLLSYQLRKLVIDLS
mmetsp:Transcript_1492/g.3233  ORF Transcript_1492/g.3233 Transcript_1492/m.3233 type:complete len:249 (+) Transcript_1492:664-1410(+)